MKIINLVGARPQFIKAAPISREIKKNKRIKEIIVHSGQHYNKELSKNFFLELNIPTPKYNLNVGSHDHPTQISKIILKLVKIIKYEKPDWIIVYGDTNTTLAGAIAGNRSGIKIAHVESGIRSYNNDMPEEINRVLTDRLSNVLFCPTIKATNNLKKENIKDNVYLVGDVMFDNFKYYIKKFNSNILNELKLKKNNYVLLTIHRSQNTEIEKRLSNIIYCVNNLAKSIKIIFPVHPRTLKYIKYFKIKSDKIIFVNPLSYKKLITLLKNCKFVATDSGGLQKEAFFAKKQCVTLRNETEWPETLEFNNNILCPPDNRKNMSLILSKISKKNYNIKTKKTFGNGNSAKKIIKIIEKFKT